MNYNELPDSKKCMECGERKSFEEFGVNRRRADGMGLRCKPCTTKIARDNHRKRAATQGRTVRERVPLPEDDTGLPRKRCPDCGQVKVLEEFGRNKSYRDGYGVYCRPCSRERSNRSYRERLSKQGFQVRERVEVPEGSKWCSSCKTIKPFSEWHRARSSTDGYASACKKCRSERSVRDHLKRSYGLTPEDVERMVALQHGLCAVCGTRAAEHVDHDHETGKVREVLCFTCNVMLGQAQDDPALLLRAIGYLQKHTNGTAVPGLPTWVLESRRGFILGA